MILKWEKLDDALAFISKHLLCFIDNSVVDTEKWALVEAYLKENKSVHIGIIYIIYTVYLSPAIYACTICLCTIHHSS